MNWMEEKGERFEAYTIVGVIMHTKLRLKIWNMSCRINTSVEARNLEKRCQNITVGSIIDDYLIHRIELVEI